ncbi:MAG: phosphoribosylaminoimidazolesuccinocarboxamide synthase, partial [Planctomycetota bacterium]
EYQACGSVSGVHLPPGLRLAERLPEPIFTPSTKAADGHDEPITFDQACDLVGERTLSIARKRSLRLYQQAATYAAQRGIILADTKFEFGLIDAPGGEELILVDEVLTPDSSRFWPADQWRPGENPPSFDKQYLRDYLETLNWDKTPPPPEIPQDVLEQTAARYAEAYERLVGRPLGV